MYSLETRIKALAVAGLMAASVAGSTMTAFAEVAGAKIVENAVPVSKTVQVGKRGVHFNQDFKFEATLYGYSNYNDDAPTKIDIELDGLTETNLSATGNLLEDSQFRNTTPGSYTYLLKEDENDVLDDNGYGWTMDETEYYVRVYVNKDHKVKYTILNKEDSGADQDGKKVIVASFSNIYNPNGGSNVEGDPALTVKKTVEGDYADMTKQEFTFEIEFNTPDTDNRKDKTFTAKVGDRTEISGDLAANKKYTFKLKNGEEIKFDKIPAGTEYKLTEKGVDGYTLDRAYVAEDAVVNEDGTTDDEIALTRLASTEGEDYTLQNNGHYLLIGQGRNSVEVVNTYKTITITGVVTHSAPFVIMVGALFVAVGGYVVLKKRIEE